MRMALVSLMSNFTLTLRIKPFTNKIGFYPRPPLTGESGGHYFREASSEPSYH